MTAPTMAQMVCDWKSEGVTPFGPSPVDAAHQLLSQARGLLTIMGEGWLDSHALYQRGGQADGNLTTIIGEYHAQAMSGVASLISLSILMLEDPS